MFCLRTLKLTDTLEIVWVVRRLHRTKPNIDEFREQIRTIIERTLTGIASMNAYEDRISETLRAKERKKARVEGGAGDVLVEPGRTTSRGRFDMGTHLAVTSRKTNTKRTERDIQVGKRGSEVAFEQQPDKLTKTVRFEQEALSASSSSDPHVSLEYCEW